MYTGLVLVVELELNKLRVVRNQEQVCMLMNQRNVSSNIVEDGAGFFLGISSFEGRGGGDGGWGEWSRL